MRFLWLLCSPGSSYGLLLLKLPWLPLPHPKYRISHSLPWQHIAFTSIGYFSHSAWCHDDDAWVWSPWWPHPLVPTSRDPWVLTTPPWKKSLFPQCQSIHLTPCMIFPPHLPSHAPPPCLLLIPKVLTLSWSKSSGVRLDLCWPANHMTGTFSQAGREKKI